MLLSWISALFILIAFIVLLQVLGVIKVSRQVLVLSRQVITTLQDTSLSDLDKEKAMQAFSLRLFKSFFLIVAGSALALGLPLLVVWGLQWLGLITLDAVIATSLSWPFLLVSLLLGMTAFYLLRARS